MKKCVNCFLICLFVAVLIWFVNLFADRQKLNEELIRLHVVANSDSAADQEIKLQVRDAVAESLREAMGDLGDAQAAKTYIRENLPKITAVANRVLENCGVEADAVVSLGKERFHTRIYDTFRLPAGVYESLRITIGEGEGKNWWCVVFPGLCLPETTSGFEAVAAGAGFGEPLLGALTEKEGYEIRFFLLDLLGELENKFFPE